MDEPELHNESFIQWIWETLRFDTRRLRTPCDQNIRIIEPGRRNLSDGPDFTQAHIVLDNLDWYGDIELHINESDWYHHNHHRDPNYNNVVLHVYLNPGNPAKRSDGTQPQRLNLSPHLPDRIQTLVATFASPNRLPCQPLIAHLSEEVLHQQFQKAHKEYFEQKVDDLLEYYPSAVPLDEAWKQMVLTALFDGLGIAHNREPMRHLLQTLDLDYSGTTTYDPEKLRVRALKLSGIRSPRTSFQWKHKGSRPNNHPTIRIQQAAWLAAVFLPVELKTYLKREPKSYWEALHTKLPESLHVGIQRREILFGTVFLPSLYLLGALGASRSLKQRSFDCWQKLRTPIPRSLMRPIRESGISPSVYRHRLGTIYQLRYYCKAHRCHQCEVLKNSLGA